MRKLTDLDKIVREKIQRLEKTAFKTIAAETKNFVKENFKKQGFQAASLQPWKPRKTTDAKGRDLLFYKRGKRKGRLTKFGRRHEGRAILIGHYSGNKMRDSFRAVRSGNKLRSSPGITPHTTTRAKDTCRSVK